MYNNQTIIPKKGGLANVHVLPNCPSTEAAVLGAVILENKAFDRIADILKPEMFYRPQNQMIFDAVVTLKCNAQPVDYLTIIEQLRKNGELETAGGILYISEIMSTVASSANLKEHALYVMEKWVRREEITASRQFMESLFDESNDLFDSEMEFNKAILRVKQHTERSRTKNLNELTIEGIERLELLKNNPQLRGAIMPFPRMARNLPYLSPGDYTVIAADTGVGKSALALNILMAVKQGIMFSFEMSNFQNWKRALAMTTYIDSRKFLAPEKLTTEEWAKIHRAAAQMDFPDLHFCDQSFFTVEKIHAESIQLFRKKPLPLIVADYIGIINNSDAKQGNEVVNLDHKTTYLKRIAMDMSTHVIGLAQFVKRNELEEPTINDIRGSAKIKQDADNVILIYRINEDNDGSKEVWDSILDNARSHPEYPITYEPFLTEAQRFKFDRLVITLAKSRSSDRGLEYLFYFHKSTNQLFEIESLTQEILDFLEPPYQYKPNEYENQNPYELPDTTPLDF